jgi:hypothetical protein
MIMAFLALGVLGVSIALTVLELMAYYYIFVSTDPRNATMFFVLGMVGNFIGIGVLMAVFVFINRNKDFGMPPRGGQVIDVASAWIPPQQM